MAIVGAGRMGQGLALALDRSGTAVALLARRVHPVVEPLVLHEGPWHDATRKAGLVLIATPDDAIAGVAHELFEQQAVGTEQVVLHLSGLLDRTILESLVPTGAGLGSFHPLQTISDPLTAPARLLGAYAGIEGDERARSAGESLAHSLGMRPVQVTAHAKPGYHAAAVFASNYVVTLAAVAGRLAGQAGVASDDAFSLYLPLLRGAAGNLDAGPAAALTGPIARGDLATIAAHLEALGPVDRDLYCQLGLATLAIAREAGLSDEAAEDVRALLAGKR